MNKNSTSDDAISVENSPAAQHPHVDNEQRGNSTQNEFISAKCTTATNTTKKLSMTPTLLEHSVWSRRRSSIAAGVFAIFTIIAISIGILTVCFTSPKATVQKFELKCKPTAQKPVEYKYGPRSVAVGDFDNDTCLDMVIAHHTVNKITVYLGYANYGTNNVGVLLGYGNGSFENQMMLNTGTNSHPISIAVGDFNGDREVDIAVANDGTKHVDMMLGNGQGKFAIQTSYEIGFDTPPLVMASGDFNNDVRSEIAIAYDGRDHVDIFVAYNYGSFETQTRYSVGSGPFSVAIGDVNNDIQLDIVVANRDNNDVSILLGYGNGSFENQTRYVVGSYPSSVAIADVNNDTRLDIVVANLASNDNHS
ncbi:unnamed protein product [Rotaria sordida]|uniref:VCBS repeat-containing protein n=1 Tax=Rotaria sordida TaxID=392033 RepID=A0A815W0L0_9BILA|nr:unnamed protein product [Rotaria sordida]